MKGDPTISPIWRQVRSAPRDPDAVFARIWAKCRDLWVDHGTVAVKPDELPAELRAPLMDWANETYGQRRAR